MLVQQNEIKPKLHIWNNFFLSISFWNNQTAEIKQCLMLTLISSSRSLWSACQTVCSVWSDLLKPLSSNIKLFYMTKQTLYSWPYRTVWGKTLITSSHFTQTKHTQQGSVQITQHRLTVDYTNFSMMTQLFSPDSFCLNRTLHLDRKIK